MTTRDCDYTRPGVPQWWHCAAGAVHHHPDGDSAHLVAVP